MENVSQAYKSQIKKTIRNQSFVRISYGMFNLDAADEATFNSTAGTSYSRLSLTSDILPEYSYATLEENKMKVGSTQIIVPKAQSNYKYQGFVSQSISNSDSIFEEHPTITISFATEQDINGLTLNFDPVEQEYPALISVNGEEFEVTSNIYVAPIQIYGATKIRIEVLKLYKPYQRARLAQIGFGQTIIFSNIELENFSYSSKVDLVSGELSTKKLSFTIDNHNQKYNPLNPQGLFEFVDEKQIIKVEYGYELDNQEIEWVLGDTMVLEGTPKIENDSVTFSAIDNLTNLTGLFYKGLYRSNGITLYDLAVEVLTDAGLESQEYTLDEYLKGIKTTGALPIISHKECLQIIANAGQSILSTNRKGQIEIQTALEPTVRVSDNNHIYYSDIQNSYDSTTPPTIKYAELLPNSMKVGSESTLIIPKVQSRFLKMGYISNVYGNANGEFDTIQPTYTLEYSYPYYSYSLPITFDDIAGEYATDFDLKYYLDDYLIDTKTVTQNKSVTYDPLFDVSNMNRIEIVIKKWSVPYHRAVINAIGKGRISDFRIDFNSSLGKPTITKKELTKNVSVLSYSYFPSSETTVLVQQKITGTGQMTLSLQHEAAQNISATLSSGSIVSQQHYTYMSIIKVNVTGEAELTLNGKKIQSNTISVIKEVNPKGKEKTPIQNPLITNTSVADIQTVWIADFYKKRNYLAVDYRGNPEIDAYDIIYMESQFEPIFPVRIKETKITFNGALRGNITAVKI